MLSNNEHAGDLGVIAEGDSDLEESNSDDESIDQVEIGDGYWSESISPIPSYYLQAFSHFSYRFTNKKVMVCDLQGVFNRDTVPPTFELTDPVIHYTSKRGRKMVFGRTDKGKKGTQLFFNTHKCSNVCRLMQLSKKNKQWSSEYRQRKPNHSNGM